MTKELIEIHWTSGSLDEARRVSRFLVQERYVAAAQIIPWVESIYQLNNQMETSQESKIVVKTKLENFQKIKEIILANCKYEVPEVLWYRIEGGSQAYLDWLQSSVLEHAEENK